MMILTLRTDKPTAEISLWKGETKVTELSWEAHRQLADTVHSKLEEVLEGQRTSWSDIGGLVVYKGPGSFTGLRIGLSVANALAYGLRVPIIAQSGEDWCHIGIVRILAGENDQMALPDYGAEAHITMPKK